MAASSERDLRPAPGLVLVQGNRLAGLAADFADRLVDGARDPRSLLRPRTVLTPSRHVERYLVARVAERRGVSAGLRFARLERFARHWLAGEDEEVLDRSGFERALLGLLFDPDADLPPEVRGYVVGGSPAAQRRRVQLARRLAGLFHQYTLTRPELFVAWRAGKVPPLGPDPGGERSRSAAWQGAVFRALVARHPRHLTLPEALTRGPVAEVELPARVHLFGVSTISPLLHQLLARLAGATQLVVHALNPCAEFWEDLQSEGERRRDLRKGATLALPFDEDPEVADPLLLRAWGRPGREHLAGLRAVSETHGVEPEDRFETPGATTLLARVQADVLHRRRPAARREANAADRSVQLVSAPSVRREVEHVTVAIGELLAEAEREGRAFALSDVAVLYPPGDEDLYLGHIAAAFAGQYGERGLPHRLVEPQLIRSSRILEAALHLLELPSRPFTRREVLTLLFHPALRLPGALRAAPRDSWLELLDEVGATFGIDAESHAGTYLRDEREDVVHFDQALARLTLGELVGDAAVEGLPLVPQAVRRDDAVSALTLVLRSLAADVRALRGAELPASRWAAVFRALFSGYLEAREEREESDLRRCLASVARLERLGTRGGATGGAEPTLGFAAAAEILRDELRLLRRGGDALTGGVIVGPLAIGSALPFAHVFCIGLGEGRFPASPRVDPLDLRGATRRTGDVSPAERDRYAFLELVLGVGDRLTLSWVGRDATTGDEIEPASVVRQLVETLEEGYLESIEPLIERPALRPPRPREAPTPAPRAARREVDDAPKASLPEVRRVTLANLRRFLEFPLEGWARGPLGIEREDDGATASEESEPFQASGLEVSSLLREAFLSALTQRVPPAQRYAELVASRKRSGRWPLGVLAEERRTTDLAVLDGWRRLFVRSFRGPKGKAVRLRLGAPERDEALIPERVHPPLRLGADRAGVPLELVGTSEALLDDAQASLLLVTKAAKPGKERQREILRYGLRAFLDHVVSRALADVPAAHRAHLFFGGAGAEDAPVRFGALEPARARAYLAGLAEELHTEEHGYFLPCEAVFLEPGAWNAMTPERLHRQIGIVRRRDGGSARHGVMAGADVPLPPPERALAMAERRFGLYFSLLAGGSS